MKILLLGEYSNVHHTLSKGLKELGHAVTVASDGDHWKNFPRDIDLARKTGTLGTISYLAKLCRALPRLKGYDIIQLINPIFLELKAEHITPIYRYLKRRNKKVVLGAFGMDHYWVSVCCQEKPLRYSDFNIGDKLRDTKDALKERKEWLGTGKERLNKTIARECDGIVAGLYENWICYHPHFKEKTIFIPYPIEMNQQQTTKGKTSEKTNIFIGINKTRNEYKGTDIMLAAAQRLAEKYPDKVILKIAESVPFEQYNNMMDNSDIVLDQLYSYTPSMNALLAMSKGIVVCGGGEPENYEIIHEQRLRPIINVQPTFDSVYEELEKIILNPPKMQQMKEESVEYISRYHRYEIVAQQYEKFYEQLLKKD